MIPPHFLLIILIIIIISILSIPTAVHAQSNNINVGVPLYANEKSVPWRSPSGDFAFGFRNVTDKNDQFLLAIWYDKIPERTIIWYAKGDHQLEETAIGGRESKVELIATGHLVFRDAGGMELWRSQLLPNSTTAGSRVSHAAMLDTGDFVIASENSGNFIWRSFKYPTDTILPGQELEGNDHLSSISSEGNYSKGRYQLRFNDDDGSLILNQVDMFVGKPYNPYFNFDVSGSRLIFNNVSGLIQIENSSNGSMQNLAPPQNYVPKLSSNYYRATLNFYGVFTLYSYPKDRLGGGGSWSVVWFEPQDICGTSAGTSDRDTSERGIGPCGYNSICEIINDGTPNCTCPHGFSLLDENNRYTGCKQDYSTYPADCRSDGSTVEQDRFELKAMSFVDFTFNDYGTFRPANEFECTQSCLRDCSCAVAILQDPAVAPDGIGTCWKKRLPLSNGRFNRNGIDRTAMFKVLKSDGGSGTKPAPPNQCDVKDQSQAVLILSALLGTSGTFNFLSLAAISLIFFCLFRKRDKNDTIHHSGRDLETNLRSFAYKELEQATNGFSEEIGRGAFGAVYKGELPKSQSYGHYVAIKKLEKYAQEGEMEFKTEVKVIGQTHHKNLVRLIGYCDEGVHRLLVYEFMGNGSLSSFLFGVLRPSWEQRLKIASGIAKGLTYLHEECSTQIIHCDIKPQNILLDDSFIAKISDFGLAKLLINNNTRTQTGIRGTKGYVAPEWFRNTPVTVKVDVYSFGVMLLEIICCRKCVHVEMEEAAILSEWAFDCYREGVIDKLVEKDEEATRDVGKVEMLVKVAIWCVQENPSLRPSMRTVTMMLEGAVLVPPPPYPFLVNSMSLTFRR